MQQISQVDHLVIGSGIAGLTYALRLAEGGRQVMVVTKKEHEESSTNRAQGGIATVLDPADSFASHVRDTLIAGAGLCHEETVHLMVEEGPERIRELIDWGVRFSRGADPEVLALGMEGGHSHRRIAHAQDLTGAAIEAALIAACSAHAKVELRAHQAALDLLQATDPRGRARCHGALILDTSSGRSEAILAQTTVLCTGGSGQVFQRTTNPSIATGDGIAMAFRAGVPLANMEFIQFHPTALSLPEAESFLISEAVRGEGGLLRVPGGQRFMHDYDPRLELAPRDIVARAIDAEMKAHGHPHMHLDVTHFEPGAFRRRFPNIHDRCLQFGIDPETEPIPVAPSAHYTCGGVITDHQGATELVGLYAVGEVACTGVHGANRLASNSLLEAVVFAHRAAVAAQALAPADPAEGSRTALALLDKVSRRREKVEASRATTLRQAIAVMMQEYVGIVRSRKRLQQVAQRLAIAAAEIEALVNRSSPSMELMELQSIVTTGLLIAQSAFGRTESRGLHWVQDHPQSDEVPEDTVIRPEPGGRGALVTRVPVGARWARP